MNIDIGFDPVIAQLGPFQLGWHGLFTGVAVLVAIQVAAILAKCHGVDPEAVYTIAGWGVVGGIVGARLFHVADHLPYYLANPLTFFRQEAVIAWGLQEAQLVAVFTGSVALAVLAIRFATVARTNTESQVTAPEPSR